MNTYTIARRTGLLSINIERLLRGQADPGTASKLGVLTSSLQSFLNGKANIAMASKLGIMTSDLQVLLDSIENKGAIGLVIGLLLDK